MPCNINRPWMSRQTSKQSSQWGNYWQSLVIFCWIGKWVYGWKNEPKQIRIVSVEITSPKCLCFGQCLSITWQQQKKSRTNSHLILVYVSIVFASSTRRQPIEWIRWKKYFRLISANVIAILRLHSLVLSIFIISFHLIATFFPLVLLDFWLSFHSFVR